MFIAPERRRARRLRARTRSSCTRPALEADPAEDGTRTGTFIALHPTRGEVLIGGTFYTGEIKKSIFTLHERPAAARGRLPDALLGERRRRGDVAIFFGLSGTGKTTLSADPERQLIGDDEHGWGDTGVFNFEGGCYAKVIRLSAEAEPEIYATTRRFGTLLENVVVDEHGRLDLDSEAKTENTRGAYPPRGDLELAAGEARGPPVERRLPDRRRVRRHAADRAAQRAPRPPTTSSRASPPGSRAPRSASPSPRRCSRRASAGPFLPQPPAVYARLLDEKLLEHTADGLAREHRLDGRPRGPTGATGCRSRRRARCSTRRSRARSTSAEMRRRPGLRLRGAGRGPGVDTAAARSALDLERSGGAYDAKARELAALFRENFAQFDGRRPRGRRGGAAPNDARQPAIPLASWPWKRRTTSSSSAPAARACARRSRRSTPAPTSRVVSKLHPTRSHSGAAEGGINAALGNATEDSPETHAFDTVKGSDFLADQDAVEIFTREAPGDIYQLEHWGAMFTRAEDGQLAQRPFGAAGSPRTVFAADITGHVLIQVLYEQLVKRGITVYEEYFAWKLVEDGGRCAGVIAWDLLNGGLKTVAGTATVLATGGIGRIYRITTNAYACTGDGAAMALRLGLPLKDMEFMQFHPTTLVPDRDPDDRGLPRRGRLPDQQGRRAVHEALRAERARARLARRRLARRSRPRSTQGRGVNGSVMLDMRHLGAAKIIDRLPGSRELAITYAGVDPIYDPVPGPARAPTTTWAASPPTSTGSPSSPGSTPPARPRASRCTAPTGSAATR